MPAWDGFVMEKVRTKTAWIYSEVLSSQLYNCPSKKENHEADSTESVSWFLLCKNPLHQGIKEFTNVAPLIEMISTFNSRIHHDADARDKQSP